MPPLILGAIFGFIASVFISIGSALASVMAVVVPILARIWNGLSGVFVTVSRAIGSFARAVARFGGSLWTSYIRPIVRTLVSWYDRFIAFIRNVMAPILEVLERIHAALDWAWDNIIEPILNAIERIKLVFRGLEVLGIEFAGRFADWLDDLQAHIESAFTTVVNHVNLIDSIISDILDPAGWIKGQPWFLSVERWAGGTMSILVALGLNPELELELARQREDIQIPNTGEYALLFSTGELAQDPGVRRAVAEFQSGAQVNASRLE